MRSSVAERAWRCADAMAARASDSISGMCSVVSSHLFCTGCMQKRDTTQTPPQTPKFRVPSVTLRTFLLEYRNAECRLHHIHEHDVTSSLKENGGKGPLDCLV